MNKVIPVVVVGLVAASGFCYYLHQLNQKLMDTINHVEKHDWDIERVYQDVMQ